MFTLKVRDKFCAAHQLVGYPGDCAKLHGHTWKVEVIIDGACLNSLNMLIDFRIVKGIMKEAIAPLDHAGSLNDILEVDLPTAEYLSWYLYNIIHSKLAALDLPGDIKLKAVTVWESDNAGVTYDEIEYE